MSTPVNILSPIDMIGSLIEDREPGETLADYRSRLVKVAEALGHADLSDPNWHAFREQELTARAGAPVRLIPGGDDRTLRKEAYGRLLTWRRLASWQGPFRWPEPAASGKAYRYNAAQGLGSGIAAAQDLAPYRVRNTDDVVVGPGYVLIEGLLYYIPARLERIVHLLPDGTTETVLLPFQIIAEHAHRIDIVDADSLSLVADDHTHTITRTVDDKWTMTGGDHTHELVPVSTNGPAFLRTGSLVAARSADIDGSPSIPIPLLQQIVVQTEDGAHEALVDPYDYYSGVFTIGDNEHTHEVYRTSVDDFYLTAQATTDDAHTHRIRPPVVPDNRFLTPIMTQHEDDVFDARTQNNPYAAYLRVEDGWTVISNPAGFGEVLVIGFDVGQLIDVPVETNQEGFILGIGPELPATQVHIPAISGGPAGSILRMTIRSEDKYTGAVGNTTVTARLELGTWVGNIDVLTDRFGEGLCSFTLPDPGPLTGVLSFTIDGNVVGEHTFVATQVGAALSGYGATPWGLDYGA